MFSNEELRKIMKLAGVSEMPELQESDHIDLEIAVEPEDSGEPGDYGVPDGISEPVAPTFEEPMNSDEYGIPMDAPMPGGMDELPSNAAEEPVVVALAIDEPMDGQMGGMGDEMGGMGDEMGGMGGEMGGGCGCGQGQCPRCGAAAAEPGMGHGGDMTSAFASMPDDDFIKVIQGGMPEMDASISEFDDSEGDEFGNEDGEESPVGSEDLFDDAEYMEVEEEFDFSNGYDENYEIDGEYYFPTGHDSNIRKKGGPLPDKADNNLNTTALPVEEAGDDLAESLYNKYVDEYRLYLKEGKG